MGEWQYVAGTGRFVPWTRSGGRIKDKVVKSTQTNHSLELGVANGINWEGNGNGANGMGFVRMGNLIFY